jgi:hypothetical protein
VSLVPFKSWGEEVSRAALHLVEIALITVLVLTSIFSVVEVSALMGMVRFRGAVWLPEAWSYACYGSYECHVTVQEIISDPEGLLTIGSSVSVCYLTPLGLAVGEIVECYGYYYHSSGPMGLLTHCVCESPSLGYYAIRVSTLGDVDRDSDVDIFDVVKCAGAYGSTPSDPNWNIHCDIAEPYWIVDIFDIVMMASNYGEEYIP